MRLWLLFILAGCAAPISGVSVERPEPGPAQDRATTANGLRVLVNGRVGRSRDGAWMATSSAQLRRLWDRIGGEGTAPDVDFDTYVVLGTSFEDGVCQPEINAVEVDAEGTLTLKVEPHRGACIALAVRVGVAVAVPRSVLPETFVWAPRGRDPWVRRFSLPPYEGPGIEALPRTTLEREELAERRGIVELPSPGTIALRSLDDGRQVWVARHADDAIAVVAADRVPSPDTAMRQRVVWNPEVRRFRTGHDSFGRSISGGDALPTHAFRRVDAEHIEIGALVELPDGGIMAREDAPTLDGPASPYAELELVTELPEGRIVRVDTPLVLGLEGPPRLCTPPSDRKMLAHFLGCETGPTHGRAESRPGVTILGGPLVVRRRGDELDLVIGLGGGVSSGVRDYRIQPPAPRGATRERGRLEIGASVSGDTRGARDGFAPACVAAAGAPDESWVLRSPRARRVGLVLESEYDGALAVVRGDGAVLDCNDDRHGHYFSSVVHVDLEPNVPVRVIVDGFGGAAGAYRLSAVHEDPLPNGGSLELDAPLEGDTTHATDDQSSGCSAPGHDQAYRFEIREAATYRFRIEATGWNPMLVVRVEGADQPLGCRVGHGSVESDYPLEPGTYRVIVDAARDDAMGRYRLSASRVD